MTFSSEKQTLIAVSKDEELLNFLRKLAESKQGSQDQTISESNGNVNIVPWNEKTWQEQKKSGQIASKILFIGALKGNKQLRPFIDIVYQEYGVSYGWSGKQALIICDPSFLNDARTYGEFVQAFNALNIPEHYKIIIRGKEVVPTNLSWFDEAKAKVKQAVRGVQDIVSDKSKKTQELLMYGICHFYQNHLSDFMKN